MFPIIIWRSSISRWRSEKVLLGLTAIEVIVLNKHFSTTEYLLLKQYLTNDIIKLILILGSIIITQFNLRLLTRCHSTSILYADPFPTAFQAFPCRTTTHQISPIASYTQYIKIKDKLWIMSRLTLKIKPSTPADVLHLLLKQLNSNHKLSNTVVKRNSSMRIQHR